MDRVGTHASISGRKIRVSMMIRTVASTTKPAIRMKTIVAWIFSVSPRIALEMASGTWS